MAINWLNHPRLAMRPAGAAIKATRRSWESRIFTLMLRGMCRNNRFRRIALAHLFSKYFDERALGFVTFPDHVLFVDPRDQMIGYRSLCGESWQRNDLTKALALLDGEGALRKGGVFVDVGANIGTQTLYAMRSGCFARALAIEPEPSNFSLLKRNIEANGLSDRVLLLERAASSKALRSMLTISAENSGGHSLRGSGLPAGSRKIAIEAQPLDRMIAEAGIAIDTVSLVWMDVEGHELEAFKGMAGVLKAGIPLVIEMRGTSGQSKVSPQMASMFGRSHVAASLRTAGFCMPVPLDQLVLGEGQHDVVIFLRRWAGASH